jgi:hypothetical protein
MIAAKLSYFLLFLWLILRGFQVTEDSKINLFYASTKALSPPYFVQARRVRKHINSLSVLRFSNGLKLLQRSALPHLLILLTNDVEMNPGPEGTPETVPPAQQLNHNMRCLYFNARSLVNKTTEFQALVTDFDIVAITETWLNAEIGNCELLPGQNFTIHRKYRADRIGGGVLLAVRNNIFNLRRKELESDSTEMLACEIRPKSRKKLLVLVF